MPTYLNSIYQQFLTETQTLLVRFSTPIPKYKTFIATCDDVHESGQEMCIVRLYDSWSRFCRELVILSACYQPVRSNGSIIPLASGMRLNDRQHTIAELERRVGRQDKNIGWGIANFCIQAANRLNVYNRIDISNSIGSTPSPADDIRAVRNFLAHRNMHTASEVRGVATRLNLPVDTRALQIAHTNLNSNMKLFESWIFDLRLIASNAVE